VLTFVARRLVLGAAVLLLLSLGTFYFFAKNFYGDTGSAVSGWWHWLQGIPSGRSFQGAPLGVSVPHLGPALGHTAVLLGLTLVIVVVVAIAVGTISAATSGRTLDVALRLLSYSAWAVPAFLFALILQTVFSWAGNSLGIHPFPLYGWAGYCPPAQAGGFYNGPCPTGHGAHYVTDVLRHAVLPAVALATSFVGLHSRYLRSSLLVALHAPYTTTARAKGVPEHRVLLRHALRNSLVTFVSAVLLDFGSIFGAALAVDWVFKLGGLGTLFITEIASPTIDANQVTSLLFLTALMVLASSLLSDLAVGWLDPRVRYQ
jgi:peptide/nickel transport system permease protein